MATSSLKGMSRAKETLVLGGEFVDRSEGFVLGRTDSWVRRGRRAAIMSFLKRTCASDEHRNRVYHSPTVYVAVFNGFDRVMLLSSGRVAYLGTSKDVLPYFEKIDTRCRPSPTWQNTCSIWSTESSQTQKQVDDILDRYEKSYTGLPCGELRTI